MKKNIISVEVGSGAQGKKKQIIFAKYGETVRAVFGREELESAHRALDEALAYVQDLLNGTSIRAKEYETGERS